jgi:hypothetical protein
MTTQALPNSTCFSRLQTRLTGVPYGEELNLKGPFMTLMSLAKYEQKLKWIALGLGILSTIAIIRDWYPWTMFIGLPFCLIWAYCAWLHTERQLKWINMIFLALYSYGIADYFL